MNDVSDGHKKSGPNPKHDHRVGSIRYFFRWLDYEPLLIFAGSYLGTVVVTAKGSVSLPMLTRQYLNGEKLKIISGGRVYAVMSVKTYSHQP